MIASAFKILFLHLPPSLVAQTAILLVMITVSCNDNVIGGNGDYNDDDSGLNGNFVVLTTLTNLRTFFDRYCR